jgi:hypothetical protein
MVDFDESNPLSAEGTAIFQTIQSIILLLTIAKSKTQTFTRKCLVGQVALLHSMVHCEFEEINRGIKFSLDRLDLTLDEVLSKEHKHNKQHQHVVVVAMVEGEVCL